MSLSRETQEKIKTEFYLPYLAAVSDSKKDVSSEIRSDMYDVAEMYAYKIIMDRYKAPARTPHHHITELTRLYLEEDFKEKYFPGVGLVAVQTYIRELLFNQVNPDQPIYLMFSKSNCQNNYITQPTLFPKLQTYPNDLVYVVADKVLLYRGVKMVNKKLVVEDRVSKLDFLKSFFDSKQTTFKLFTSFYQAMEYVDSQTNDNTNPKGVDDTYPPTLWAVTYKGNIADLNFKQASLRIHRGWSSLSEYNRQERQAEVSFAEVDKNAVQPILGAVLVNGSNFGSVRSYFSMESYNFIKELIEEAAKAQPAANKSKCALV